MVAHGQPNSTLYGAERIEALVKKASGRPVRVGIVSMYDVENNAVRILAGTLREGGHHVAEIYFKDWISNHLDPATDEELASLNFPASKGAWQVVGAVKKGRESTISVARRVGIRYVVLHLDSPTSADESKLSASDWDRFPVLAEDRKLRVLKLW